MTTDRNGVELKVGDRVMLVATVDSVYPAQEHAKNLYLVVDVPSGERSAQFFVNSRAVERVAPPSSAASIP